MNEIYNLDWKEYNNLVYNSISFKYFPKDIESDKGVEVLYELEKEKVVYVLITKNASTSVINSLNFVPISFIIKPFYSGIDSLDIPEKYRSGYKFVIITRDPKQRWISGINEFIYQYLYERSDFDGDEKEFRNTFLLELKDNKFIFDFHTVPQLSCINFCFKYDLDITFLKLDNTLNDKISSIVKRQVYLSHENLTKEHNYKLKNYKFCYDALINYCIRNKNFLNLYKMDSYLYNSSS